MKIQKFMHFSEVTSTNTVARQWVESALTAENAGLEAFCEENLPAVVMADRQNAGRGRDGRPWVSPPGCLMFTLVFSREMLDVPPEKAPLFSLAAGLAVRDAVRETVPEVEKVGRLGIHWPNDVCLMVPGADGALTERKLCGILVEQLACGIFIMGIGVNVHNSYKDAPPEVQPRLFSLADIAWELGDAEFQRVSQLPLSTVLDTVLEKLATRLAELAADSDRLVRAVDACCVQRGEICTLNLPHGQVTGFCTGLAADGRILLDGKAYHTGEFR